MGNLPPLLEAAKNGDAEAVESLLDDGEDSNQTEGIPYHCPALYFAVSYGHVQVARLLINRGADPNLRGISGQTYLHYSHARAVPFLIQEHGLDVNVRDNDGNTPLHVASPLQAPQSIAVLLDHGANMEEKNHDGLTPLACAANKGDWDTVRFLLGQNANILNALQGLLSDRRSYLFSVVHWVGVENDPEQHRERRSILSALRADALGIPYYARYDWLAIVGILWYHIYGTDNEGPPVPADISEFSEAFPSDQAFLEAHRWMIHPLASLLHKGSGRLLKLLFNVYDPALALEEYHRRHNRHLLWTALETWSCPQEQDEEEWDQQDQERASEGFESLIDANPAALQVPHPENGRFPLAAALAKGLPMRVIVKMAKLWPEAVALEDPVTGLPIFTLASNNHRYYSVADVYFLSRFVLPHLAVQVLRNKNNN